MPGPAALLLALTLWADPAPEATGAPPSAATPTSTPTSTPAPAPAPAEPPAEPAAGPDDEPVLVHAHAVVEQTLQGVVERFDRFFADDRARDLERPSTRVRLKNSLRAEDDGSLGDRVGASATVKLPALERWLGNARLVLVGSNTAVATPETGDEVGTAPPPPAPTPSAAELKPRSGSVELRFDLFRARVVSGDLGAGVKAAWPPVPYGRARVHARADLAEGLVLRATESLFYELGGDGFGTTTELSLEAFPTEHVRARISSGVRWSEVSRGLEWSQLGGVAWVHQDRYAVYLAAQGLAVTRPASTFDATRLFTGLRSNLWKGRLFGQVEPEIAWIDGATGPLRRVLAVTATLEIVYESRPVSP